MKVKRTSWHYHVSTLLCNYEKNDNLCWYFWRLVFTILGLAGATAFIILAGYAYVTSLQFISTSILIVAMFLAIVLLPLAIYFLRETIGKSPEIPCENILFEYLKAKKRKVCPLIEYIN